MSSVEALARRDPRALGCGPKAPPAHPKTNRSGVASSAQLQRGIFHRDFRRLDLSGAIAVPVASPSRPRAPARWRHRLRSFGDASTKISTTVVRPVVLDKGMSIALFLVGAFGEDFFHWRPLAQHNHWISYVC